MQSILGIHPPTFLVSKLGASGCKKLLFEAIVLFLICAAPIADVQFANGQTRITAFKSENEKEDFTYLDANDRAARIACLLPRITDQAKTYNISSASETPLEDFHAAIAEIALSGGPAQIVFDGGTYQFSSDEASILKVTLCKDLRIVGNGSRLIFESPKTGFKIKNSNRVMVSDFKITYRNRVASFGTIVVGCGCCCWGWFVATNL